MGCSRVSGALSGLRCGAGKLQAARGRLQALPLAMKLENMRGDLERERTQLEAKSFDADLQQAAGDIDAATASLRAAAQRLPELRRERDRLGAATQAATRYRVAQENVADLQAQVCLSRDEVNASNSHSFVS